MRLFLLATLFFPLSSFSMEIDRPAPLIRSYTILFDFDKLAIAMRDNNYEAFEKLLPHISVALWMQYKYFECCSSELMCSTFLSFIQKEWIERVSLNLRDNTPTLASQITELLDNLESLGHVLNPKFERMLSDLKRQLITIARNKSNADVVHQIATMPPYARSLKSFSAIAFSSIAPDNPHYIDIDNKKLSPDIRDLIREKKI